MTSIPVLTILKDTVGHVGVVLCVGLILRVLTLSAIEWLLGQVLMGRIGVCKGGSWWGVGGRVGGVLLNWGGIPCIARMTRSTGTWSVTCVRISSRSRRHEGGVQLVIS